MRILLEKYGANREAKNIHGQIPYDLVSDKDDPRWEGILKAPYTVNIMPFWIRIRFTKCGICRSKYDLPKKGPLVTTRLIRLIKAIWRVLQNLMPSIPIRSDVAGHPKRTKKCMMNECSLLKKSISVISTLYSSSKSSFMASKHTPAMRKWRKTIYPDMKADHSL